MFCTQCGTELRPGIKFCTQCGTEVKGTNTETSQKIKEGISGSPQEPVQMRQKNSSGGRVFVTAGILVVLFLVAFGGIFWVIQGKEQKASMLSRRDSAPKFETGETTTLVEEHTKQITAAEEQTSSVFAEEKALTEEALSEESEEIISESVPKQSEYLLPDSDHKFLTKEDLNGFDAEMCRIARNELYARHGRKFSDIELQAYFDRCSWYEGTIEGDIFQESILNEYEIANRDLIVAYEKEMGYR